MDPINNPTPTPNSTPNPAPNPTPTSNSAPTTGTDSTSASVPASPNVASGGVPAAAGEVNSNPVNPVVTPSNPGNPVAPANLDGQLTSSPFNPALSANGIGATDPIMRPEPAKGPDPIEEELKAPMKAAGPAPGSIGSAISGPTQENAPAPAPVDNPFSTPGNTPNVAFNDPATQPDAAANGGVPSTPNAKPKKTNKTTLIALIAVAAIVIIILVVVLVMSLNNSGSGSSSSSNNNGNNNSTVVVDDNIEEEEGDTTVATTTLSCVRNMTAAELAEFGNERQAVIDVEMDFNDNDEMVYISVLKSGVYQEGEVEDKNDMNSELQEVTIAELNTADAEKYYLPVNENGEIPTSFDDMKANFESLDFVCQVL